MWCTSSSRHGAELAGKPCRRRETTISKINHMYIYIYDTWVNYSDLIATSLGMMVSRGDYPQMTLFQIIIIYPDTYNRPVDSAYSQCFLVVFPCKTRCMPKDSRFGSLRYVPLYIISYNKYIYICIHLYLYICNIIYIQYIYNVILYIYVQYIIIYIYICVQYIIYIM